MLDLDKKEKAASVYKSSLSEICAVLDMYKDLGCMEVEYNRMVDFLGQLYAASGGRYMSSDPHQCSHSQRWLLINGKRELEDLAQTSKDKGAATASKVLIKLMDKLKNNNLIH